MGEAQLIVADLLWSSKICNGVANLPYNVKPKRQLINKLMVGCHAMAQALTFSLGPIWLPSGQHQGNNTTSLPCFCNILNSLVK